MMTCLPSFRSRVVAITQLGAEEISFVNADHLRFAIEPINYRSS